MFTCYYCLARETEAGPVSPNGDFEIEHFRPVSKFKQFRLRYRNLMWACRLCNRTKGDAWPSRADELEGRRFPDPHKESLGAHLEIVGHRVVARNESTEGAYFIETLRLNSAVQMRRRQRIESQVLLYRTCEKLLKQQLERSEPVSLTEIDSMRRDLDRVRQELEGTPSDAPSACECAGA
jgi:hypothetical protein